MNTIKNKKNFQKLSGLGAVLYASVVMFGLVFMATPAFAGVGLGVVPSLPSTVMVGDTNVPGSVAITNVSNEGDGLTVELTHIHFTPSCGDTSGGHTCLAPDPGVFSVPTTASGSGECAGVNFTGVVDNVTTGQILFTPDAPVQIDVGQTCTLSFNVNVLKAPTVDTAITAGLQTDQIGHALGFDVNLPALEGSGLGNDRTTVTKASPTIATVPSAGGPIGTVLTDTATLTGGSSPTGDVVFTLYAPSDATCSAAPVFTNTDTTAPYATSVGYTSLVAGTYHWKAAYAGDASNNAVTSPCADEAVVITQPQGEYCSPGYWKQEQHFDSWVGYTPNQLFSSVFTAPGLSILWSTKGKPMPLANPTLLQALEANGGGVNALVRVAVDALLNAASINSGYTPAQVIAAFNEAYPDPTKWDAFREQFTMGESCPLN